MIAVSDNLPAGARQPTESGDRIDGNDARQAAHWVAETLELLSRSSFRSSFTLSPHDAEYARRKGRELIDRHAHEMLAQRVGAAQPAKDGRQTPWRGHPVFTAQHATACCCRGCIEKWHHIPRGRELSAQEINQLAGLIMAWIDRDLASHPAATGERDGWAVPPENPKDAGAEQGGATPQPRRRSDAAGHLERSRRHPDNHHADGASGFIQGELL